MSEDPSNIGRSWKKPDSRWAYLPIGFFVGKHAKLQFDVLTLEGPRKELMWVSGLRLPTREEIGDNDPAEMELVGELNNDPLGLCEYECGDTVGFARVEIVGMLENAGKEYTYDEAASRVGD